MRKWFWPAVVAIAMAPGFAWAHPLDEVVQGAYLYLTPGKLVLELDISPGVEVVGPILAALDADGDKRVTDAEARAYAQVTLEQSTVAIDGIKGAWIVDSISVPPIESLELGPHTIKIYGHVERLDTPGEHTISFDNRYEPADSQWTANIFLQPSSGWEYRILDQKRSSDGQELNVTFLAEQP